MPKVKYDFEGDASSAVAAARQMQSSFTGIATGMGAALVAIQKLRSVYDELIDTLSKPTPWEARMQTLAGKIGDATEAMDKLIAKRREFEEGQATAELSEQIRAGDISEDTGRQLQTLDAEKKIALAEARGVADPVERAKRQAAVQKEFSGREVAIRNEGDRKQQEIKNEETRRQQVVIAEAERRRREAETIPGLQKQAQVALDAVNANTLNRDQIAAAQADVEELSNARSWNPWHWSTSRAKLAAAIDPESKEFNPAMRRTFAQFGITDANVGGMTPNIIAGAAMSARDILGKEFDETLKVAPGLQTSATATAEALKRVTGKSALTKEDAASLRQSRLDEAAGMKAGAISATSRAASGFQSLGENIAHRLGLAALGAEESKSLGIAVQKLEQSISKARESRMKLLDKTGGVITSAVTAYEDLIKGMQQQIDDLRQQLVHRK